MKIFIQLFILLFLTGACSTVNLAERKRNNQDQKIEVTDIKKINGIYSNNTNDSVTNVNYSLWQRIFINAKVNKHWREAKVKLELTGEHEVTVSLLVNDSAIETRRTKFTITNGYLNVRRQYNVKFFLGPVLWGIAGSKIFLGLSNENNLVLLNSTDGTGVLFIVPVFPSGGKFNREFRRLE